MTDAPHRRPCTRTPAPQRRARPRLRAFTLVEVLIVVLILGILASLVAPSLANASAPLARPVADLLEADLRRARLESLGSMRETLLVLGADRSSWWLQPAGELREDRALPSSLRSFGSGNMRPYGDHRMLVTIDGAEPRAGDAVLARFDSEGTRDRGTVEVALLAPADAIELARWRLEPERTKLK